MEQHSDLCAKLRGHIQYYGMSHNYASLHNFVRSVCRIWLKWLNRRGGKPITYEKFNKFLKNYPLVKPRIVHKLY